MEAEGVGAHTILSMEQGILRYSVSHGADPEIRVRVLAREPVSWCPARSIDAEHRQGLLGLALTCRGRIELEERGLVSDWVGADEEILFELLLSLEQVWQDATESSELTRVYARDGIGVKDPRTGAHHGKLKNILKRELAPFLNAWRRKAPQQQF